MKRKILLVIGVLFASLLTFTSCNKDKKTAPKEDTFVGYNYDNCVQGDYAHMTEMYGDNFTMLEVDAVFDSLMNESTDSRIVSMRVVFQSLDTCIMFHHPVGCVDSLPTITKEYGYFLECNPLKPKNLVNFDSCMKIAEPYRAELPTRKLTFRRIVGPPFPLHGEYIFGNGYLFIDSKTAALRGTLIDDALAGAIKYVE